MKEGTKRYVLSIGSEAIDANNESVFENIVDLTGDAETVAQMMIQQAHKICPDLIPIPAEVITEPSPEESGYTIEDIKNDPLAASIAGAIFGPDFLGKLDRVQNWAEQRKAPGQG